MMSFNGNGVTLAHVSASTYFFQATRRMLAAGMSGVLALALAGCGGTQATTSTSASASGETSQAQEGGQAQTTEEAAVAEAAADFSIDTSDLFSSRDLNPSFKMSEAMAIALEGDGASVSAEGVSVDGSTVTISEEGVYVLSGTLSDGRVVVDADDTDKVQLVLDGADISSSTGTALYVRNADKVFLTLAEDSKNTLEATGDAAEEDEHSLDGTVFAADDLTVNGAGVLEITSEQGSGVVAKDELTLVGGTLAVQAADHALEAKDSVAVNDGTYTLSAGTDGIHVEHETNGEKGFLYVAGGTFDITAQSDGIDASNDVLLDGGTFTISAGDDGIHSEYDLIVNDGTVDVTESYEALEGARVTVNGGDIHVVASDDGVNASGEPGSASSFAGGERGFGAGQPPQGEMPDGQPPQGEMPDGQPPQDMTPPEGDREGMDAQGDDGGRMQMPGGGQGDMGGRGAMGGGMMDADETASIEINGGTLVIDAGGDGIDSNGTLVVSGGETYVSGPTNDGNGALDYGTSATVSGGVLVAAGSLGMAEGFGSDSTQGSMLVSATGEAGDAIELRDSSGNVLASYTPTKQYACVVISAPGIEAGGTYTLSYGSQATEVTMDSLAYSDVSRGMGTGQGQGGHGGGRGFGQRPGQRGMSEPQDQKTQKNQKNQKNQGTQDTTTA